MGRIDHFAGLAPRLVDLSADFRLRDAAARPLVRHAARQPGVARALRLRAARTPRADGRRQLRERRRLQCHGHHPGRLAAGPGRLIDAGRGVICEVKVGSSEGGAASSDATHHPERAGVMRSFAPTGHRHTAEVLQALALAASPPRCT